uniref:Uncharacterized protein n=1 Tax=Biomphalaria glabrata TaxID=6526 RepID=A0A2C9LMB0_BIOGL
MPELTIDIAVANRFISSLSKSLQALCHGCMEFDTGIEIIGYININIDSGSKVDYVLNEKVLKSTNNSMTFVSNSFLAKKDQQRHTRDGSCSPIPTIQQQITPIYQARHRGSNYGASFHRSSQFSPHSQVLHGGQKRQWGSELRSPVKKHRPAGATLEKSPSHSASYTPSTSHTFTDPNFRHSSAPTNADSIEGDSEIVNIKKEALDTDHELQDQVGEQDQSTDDPTAETSGNVIIKSDPDAVQSADSETNKDDTVATDFKGTFLDPSQEATGEQNDFSNSEKVLETISKPVLSDKHNVAGPSTEGTEDSNDTIPNSGADVSLDYDQGNEDYPQSDAGEATSDTGQFEVIEIDDEDEDVQAMFGESRKYLFLT